MRMPPDWPFSDHSRCVKSAGHEWHVQTWGQGKSLLLLHGAGGSTHSWRTLAPILALHYQVTLIDLPGHAFTRVGRSNRLGLNTMAEDVAELCKTLELHPFCIIGHSAGAALALQLCHTLPQAPDYIIGVNAALGNFDGLAGVVFPIMARALTYAPFVPQLYARLNGTESKVRRLIASMGSEIDTLGIQHYQALVSDPRHVAGTLEMMANWQLNPLLSHLPGPPMQCLLIAGKDDLAVPARISKDIAEKMPNARFQLFQKGGHLLHEEYAQEVAQAILSYLQEHETVTR